MKEFHLPRLRRTQRGDEGVPYRSQELLFRRDQDDIVETGGQAFLNVAHFVFSIGRDRHFAGDASAPLLQSHIYRSQSVKDRLLDHDHISTDFSPSFDELLQIFVMLSAASRCRDRRQYFCRCFRRSFRRGQRHLDTDSRSALPWFRFAFDNCLTRTNGRFHVFPWSGVPLARGSDDPITDGAMFRLRRDEADR
jgi:hypothetical protein